MTAEQALKEMRECALEIATSNDPDDPHPVMTRQADVLLKGADALEAELKEKDAEIERLESALRGFTRGGP